MKKKGWEIHFEWNLSNDTHLLKKLAKQIDALSFDSVLQLFSTVSYIDNTIFHRDNFPPCIVQITNMTWKHHMPSIMCCICCLFKRKTSRFPAHSYRISISSRHYCIFRKSLGLAKVKVKIRLALGKSWMWIYIQERLHI